MITEAEIAESAPQSGTNTCEGPVPKGLALCFEDLNSQLNLDLKLLEPLSLDASLGRQGEHQRQLGRQVAIF